MFHYIWNQKSLDAPNSRVTLILQTSFKSCDFSTGHTFQAINGDRHALSCDTQQRTSDVLQTSNTPGCIKIWWFLQSHSNCYSIVWCWLLFHSFWTPLDDNLNPTTATNVTRTWINADVSEGYKLIPNWDRSFLGTVTRLMTSSRVVEGQFVYWQVSQALSIHLHTYRHKTPRQTQTQFFSVAVKLSTSFIVTLLCTGDDCRLLS